MNKISYALGLSIGQNFLATGIEDLNTEDFAQGVNDAMNHRQTSISYDEAKQTVKELFNNIQQKNYQLNLESGREFLRINKLKAGVTQLPSGLQYQIITNGQGNRPTAADKVRCHYHGTLINGTVFDSSIERDEPEEFKVSEVIAGWAEALPMMNTGAKWRLFIPSELAYCNQQAGRVIAPYSTLLFDIELLDIIK